MTAVPFSWCYRRWQPGWLWVCRRDRTRCQTSILPSPQPRKTAWFLQGSIHHCREEQQLYHTTSRWKHRMQLEGSADITPLRCGLLGLITSPSCSRKSLEKPALRRTSNATHARDQNSWGTLSALDRQFQRETFLFSLFLHSSFLTRVWRKANWAV